MQQVLYFIDKETVLALKTARLARGMNFYVLADKTGLSAETLIQMEQQVIPTSYENFLLIVEALGWRESNFKNVRRETS